MKIRDAKQSYTAYRSELWKERKALSALAKEHKQSDPASFDRAEISRALSLIDAQYQAVDKTLADITAAESTLFGIECNRRQAENQAKAAEEMGKIMEVYRRIASGAKVPARDQQKLMEYDFKLYMAARQQALLARQNEKEYDSLWEDEKENSAQERKTPEEVAGDAEISVPSPASVASAVSVDAEAAEGS